jgi:hypothetical protein
MVPFVAALIATGYMALVFVVFGSPRRSQSHRP